MRRTAAAAAAVLVGGLCAAAAPAPAAGLETILQDDAQLLHRPEAQLRESLQDMRALGIDRIRVTAGWSVLTRDADSEIAPSFDATDPRAYEQERWRTLDRLIVLAQQYGFQTMIDIAFWAPHWASSDPQGQRGRSHIDVEEYRKFAVAVARRYSGSYVLPHAVGTPGGRPLPRSADDVFLAENFGTTNPPSPFPSIAEQLGVPLLSPLLGQEALEQTLGTDAALPSRPLPRVDVFTIWNEPNHTSFMRPQWERHGDRWVPRSPHVYRAMVRAAYPAIKAVRPESTVLIGGTSYSGSYSGRGTGNVPPLRFLREMACVDRRLQPLARSGCAAFKTVPGDGWAHHPYTMTTVPDAPAKAGRPDDVPMAALPKLARTLERLIDRGRIGAGNRNIWVTEYGYETNPPVDGWIFSTGDQARFLPWAEYLATRVPTVRSFAQFLLRDLPPGAFRVGKSRLRAFGQWQSGIKHTNGRNKVAIYALRAGLFVQQNRAGRIRIWGRLRFGDGLRPVAVERRPEGSRAWRTVLTRAAGEPRGAAYFQVSGRQPFSRFADGTRSTRWRYRLRWVQDGSWHTHGWSVAPVRR